MNMLFAVLRFILEQPLILGWLNGHKTTVSIVLGVAAAALYVAGLFVPDLAILTQADFLITEIAAALGISLGVWHKVDKSKRGL